MKIFAVVFGWVYFLSAVVYAKKGFILTSPKALTAGSTEYFSFTAFGLTVEHRKTLLVQLMDWYTGEYISSALVHLHHNMNVWVEMRIPPSSTDRIAKLSVQGSLGDGHRIDSAKKVRVRRTSVLTFVQTDKPVYRPGQTVKFRILPLSRQLTPLEPESAVGDSWIEDPSGVRVAQWKQINYTKGLVQLELPLSSEPPLGQWRIHTVVNQVAHSHTFSVDKYELPEFEVTISPPPFVMKDADYIPLKICAWYSYGKKVDGTYHVKVTYKKYYDAEKLVPFTELSGEISAGCKTVQVNGREIQMHTSQYGRRTLEITAQVTEDTTGLTFNATAHLQLTSKPLKLKFIASEYFKPGIPFYGELLAHTPDDKAAPNEKIQLCALYKTNTSESFLIRRRRTLIRLRGPPNPPPSGTFQSHCKNFTTDKEGRVIFSVPPKSERCISITIEATAVKHKRVPYPEEPYFDKRAQPTANLYLKPWHSPSGHQVQVRPPDETLACGRQHRVRVRYTARNGTDLHFYHQVVSRGRIVQQGSHRRTHHPSNKNGAPFDLGHADPPSSPDLTPGDFSVVVKADAAASPAARLLVFHVLPSGEVVADASKIQVAPCLRNKVKLHFRHEQQYPDTDASLLLSASPGSLCGIGMVDKSITFLPHKEQFSRDKIFKVLEKLDVGKKDEPRQVSDDHCSKESSEGTLYRFEEKVSDHVDAAMAFEEAGTVVISDLELETRPCREPEYRHRIYMTDMDMRPPGLAGPVDLVSLNKGMRESQPTPSEETSKDSEAEETEIRSFFPETWLWEMHSLGPSGEVAMVRRLPHTVTTWVGGATCVHPEFGLGVAEEASISALRPFFISLRLPLTVTRGEQVPVNVAVFNYLEECLNIRLSLDPSEDFNVEYQWYEFQTSSINVCVCGGESKGHTFAVRPTKVGSTNVTVHGYSVEGDSACDGLGPLGVRDAVSKAMTVEAEGYPKEEVFNYFVCPETTNGSYAAEVDLLLPEDVVEGSERAYVSVTGDLLGPSLGHLDGLVHMPAGCGEQNLALLVPNILVLNYLQATARPDPRLQDQCLEHIRKGYQRQLQYRHGDGSYSAFGSRDTAGSTFLTAFVVRTLGQARKHVSIDEQDLARSAAWLLDRQLENGCFEASGFVLNKALKGGLSGGADSPAPLSAYVLLSLLESGALRPSASSSALSCLKSETAPTPYALALFAYAAALAKEPDAANKYLRLLEATATNLSGSTEKYWLSEEGGLSVAVETAAYYVLARIELEGRESGPRVLPVVRWMLRHRNARGGFASTQDTAVALQALAHHSSLHQFSQVDLGLAVEGEGMVKGFRVDEGNRLLTQGAEVPILPAVIDMQAVGEGCALVQYILRYNVDRSSASDAFDLNVAAEIGQQRSCLRPEIKVCMRYKIPGQTSNMAVVAVKMATGFVPDEPSLRKLQNNLDQLMRFEVDDNRVNFYFNELTNEEKCFAFFVIQEVSVLDLKAASVHLYDYYQPEHEITREYAMPRFCSGRTTVDEEQTDDTLSATTPRETISTDDGTTPATEAYGGTDISASTNMEEETQATTSERPKRYFTDIINPPDSITDTSENVVGEISTRSTKEESETNVIGDISDSNNTIKTSGDDVETTSESSEQYVTVVITPQIVAKSYAYDSDLGSMVETTEERIDGAMTTSERPASEFQTETNMDNSSVSESITDTSLDNMYESTSRSETEDTETGDTEVADSIDATKHEDIKFKEDETVEKSSDEKVEKTSGETVEKSSDEKVEKASDEADEKSSGEKVKKSSEETDKKSSEETDKKSSEETDKKSSEDTDKKSSEETDKKSSEEKVEKASEETVEKSSGETVEKSSDEKVDKVSEVEPTTLTSAGTKDDNSETPVKSAAESDIKEQSLEDFDDENTLDIADHPAGEKHLINFVDRDEDLDFPDGIEGNVPVTVVPPEGDIELPDNAVELDS